MWRYIPILIAAIACGDKKPDSEPADPILPAQDPVASLWELAPQQAFGGIVVPDGSIARLRDAWLAIEEVVGSMAGAQDIIQTARRALDLPIDLFDADVVAKAGIDLSLGAAVFFLPGQQTVISLPVADRAKFRAHTKGKRDVVDAIEIDDNKKLRGVCRVIRGRYVCAKTRDVLMNIKPGPALAKATAGLAADLRGDVELYIDVKRSTKSAAVAEIAAPVFTEVSGVAAAVVVEGGTLRARGAVIGSLGDAAGKSVGAPSPLAEAARAESPSAVLRAHVAVLPELLPAAPVTLRAPLSWKALASSITGELLVYTPSIGRPALVAALGITKVEPFRAALQTLCSSVPGARLRWAKGACTGTVDPTGLFPPGMMPVTGPFQVEAKVEDSAIRVEVTHPRIPGRDSAPAMSELGTEFLTGSYNLAIWGEAIGGALPSDSLLASGKALPVINTDAARALVWAATHVYELGFGIGVDADGLSAELRISTFAGEPPEVLASYQRAMRAALQGDKVDIDLAKQDAESLVGRQGRIYASGAYLVAAVTGMISAIAIPAVVRYQEKANAASAGSPK